MKKMVKKVYQKKVTLLMKTHLNWKNVSSIKHLGYICNKILCSFLGLDERQKNLTVGLENS